MGRNPATVEEVREAQQHFKEGVDLHEKKDFNEAIKLFQNAASVSPFDEKHLEELKKKVKSGGFKLQQESIAYMGCAAVHLSRLVDELDDAQKEQVPVDENLVKMFREWGN